MKPVRVCFLIDELASAGTETQLVALIRHLDRTRVQPYLVLLRGDNAVSQHLEPEDCPIMRLGVGSLRHPRTALRAIQFIHFLCRERIDVLQAYFPDSTYFGIPAAWMAGVPYRLRTRNNIGHWLTRAHRILGRTLNLFTSATITNCEAAKRALLADEQPDPKRVVVLENGVDLERFLAIDWPDERARTIGAAANLRAVKGLDGLIASAAQLHIEFPNVRFQIAGEGEDRPKLEESIRANGLVDHFHLCGAEKEIPRFLAGLDIAVLPSLAEGMSNALLEYMAAARPIVATAVGATPELIRDGIDGLLVPAGDVDALTKAIRRLLTDRTLACRLGASARERVVQRYSRAAMVRRFEEFYTQLAFRANRGCHADQPRCTDRHSRQTWPVLG
jgi:glycosyltransferase involved in cell wall biosynthesis